MKELNIFELPESKDKKAYFDLIAFAKKQDREGSKVRFERHHIWPKSLGGTNTKGNLVKLTTFEHLKAHYYLAKFTDSNEMYCAFRKMMSGQYNYLTENEQKNLQILEDWSILCENAKKRAIKLSQETLKRKYGGITACLNTDNARRNAQNSRKEHYGTIMGRLQEPEVRKKRNDTIVNRYGNLCGMMHTSESIAKSQKTQTKKYGFPAGQMHSREAEEKSKETRKKLGNGDCMWKCHSQEAKEKQRESRKLQGNVYKSDTFQKWYQTKTYDNHQWMTAVKDFLKETGNTLENFK